MRVLMLAFILAACEAPPALRLLDNELAEHHVGVVAITRQKETQLTLHNVSNDAVPMNMRRMHGNTQAFSVVDDACADTLAPNDTCVIRLVFSPTAEGTQGATLTLDYEQDEKPRQLHVALSGRGLLDCSVSAPTLQSRAQGASAAATENAAQAARGASAGNALTYDAGYAHAYDVAYGDGYRAGYAAGPYDSAYRAAYVEGVARGQRDASACSDGGSSGESDGRMDGNAAGLRVAYDLGERDGYVVGNDEGEAERSCGPAAREAVPADAPWLLNACRQRGYEEGLDPSAYARALKAAADANPVYQSGRSAGSADGFAAGQPAGHARAVVDGDADGYAAGYQAGAAEQFNACYDAAYQRGFAAGYAQGAASVSSYDAGFANGFEEGYAAAYADPCT